MDVFNKNPKFRIGDMVKINSGLVSKIKAIDIDTCSNEFVYQLMCDRFVYYKEACLELIEENMDHDDGKLDPNKTKDFVEVYKRMCRFFGNNENGGCYKYPLSSFNNDNNGNILCQTFLMNHTEEVIEIMQKWLDENPDLSKSYVKTIKDDLLEKFPGTPLVNGFPSICPYEVGYMDEGDCLKYGGCKQCWDQPYESTNR